MGITSSLVTGLTGLSSNQSKLDVVGNNIANINTVGFKSSRMDFKTQFSQSFSFGTPPDGELGGTNPLQVGLGTQQAAISRNWNDGSREVTGVNTHMAIEGNGFFILEDNAEQVFSRDGTFKLNSQNTLVNSDGLRVQGFGVDANYSVIPGVLTDVTIPVGGLTVAEATQNVTLDGNLNADGIVPTTVSNLTLNQPLYLSDGAGGIDATNPPAGTTLLTNVTNATGTSYFQVGDVVTAQGKKGSRATSPKTLTIDATTTLADLQSFMSGSLGINTGTGVNGAITTAPGVTIPATGNTAAFTINGNPGVQNDLALDASSLTINRGGTTVSPFSWTKNATANGESVFTSTTVYDSLGTPVAVNLIAVLEAKSSSGSTWRFFADSPDGTATGAATQVGVGTGTLVFNNFGQLTNTTTPTVNIDRSNTGAAPTLSFELNFSRMTSLSGNTSSMASTLQDGSAKGTLTNFSIGNDGIITGAFSNGLTRTLGQIALATFRNNQGLVDRGNNTFSTGPNSGTAVISAPQEFSSGRVVSGALELSNVDLSGEFVQLITASTGFSAASRVISTSNQLLQELLSAAR